MTLLQQQQFNKMREALFSIAKQYQSAEELRKTSVKRLGLDYEEALEMAYENIQTAAAVAVKGIRKIKIKKNA